MSPLASGPADVAARAVPRHIRRGHGFLAVVTLLFLASLAATIAGGATMSAMDGMPMPGGWTMSMVWLQPDGRSWPAAAASFLGMWMAMMVAMMLPSLMPVLWRCHQAFGDSGVARPGD